MEVSVEGEERWDGILRNIENKSLVGADLLPFIATVPSAMVELVKKQTEGWAYLKPGP